MLLYAFIHCWVRCCGVQLYGLYCQRPVSVMVLNVLLYWLCNYCESNSEELIIHLTIYDWQSIDACLSAVVCEDDETEVRSRWQFTETEECTELIHGVPDVYSEGFRSDCQWALNLNELPPSVGEAYVTECFPLTNGTTKFQAQICCKGTSCQPSIYVLYQNAYNIQYIRTHAIYTRTLANQNILRMWCIIMRILYSTPAHKQHTSVHMQTKTVY